MTAVTNITEGVNSVYFNDEFALVATSGFPSYTIGVFSTDDSIGPNLIGQNELMAFLFLIILDRMMFLQREQTRLVYLSMV